MDRERVIGILFLSNAEGNKRYRRLLLIVTCVSLVIMK